MSTARSREDAESSPGPPQEVTVTVWPLRDSSPRCLAVLTATALLASLAAWWSHSVPMGGLVQVVFLLVLWRLWIPVTYQLGRDGVVERVWRRRRHLNWLAITRVEVLNRGILLVADRTDTPLAAIHGIFIPWQDQRAEVLAVVEHFLLTRVDA